MAPISRLLAVATLTAGLTAGLAACSGGSDDGADGTPSPAPSSAAPSTSSAASSPGAEAAAAAGRAKAGLGHAAWSARYTLRPTSGAEARVVVALRGTDLKLELTRAGATSVLITTGTGSVSCQVAATTTCLKVAGPGQPVPELFDPGLQRVFTDDLTGLADGRGGPVAAAAPVAATGSLPAADCYAVAGDSGVDAGTYCLSADGVVRRATFASGTLDLAALGAAPAATVFTPPASPQPLPTSSASASPTG